MISQALGITLAEAGATSAEGLAVVSAAAFSAALAARKWPNVQGGLACCVAFGAGALSLETQLDAARADSRISSGLRLVEGTVERVELGPVQWSVLFEGVLDVSSGRRFASTMRLIGRPQGELVSPVSLAVPGDRFRLRVRILPFRGPSNPGEPDFDQGNRRAGVGVVARLVHPLACVRIGTGFLGPLVRPGVDWRHHTANALSDWGRGGRLLQALALGDRRGLDSDTRADFGSLGLSHLLAVSGLHVGLVAALGFGLWRKTVGRIRVWAENGASASIGLFPAFLAAAAYGVVSGAGIPVRRALVFLAVLVLSAAWARPVTPSSALALAAVVILCWEPEALFDAGAQLSFAACGAFLMMSRSPGASVPVGRVARLRDLAMASAAVSAVTAPLIAWHMGRVAPMAFLANVIAIPWTGLLLLPAALLAALFAGLPSAWGVSEWASAAVALANWSLGFVGFFATLKPDMEVAPPHAVGLILAGGLAWATLRSQAFWLRIGLGLGVHGVLVLSPPVSPGLPPPPRVVVLDVGQGDSILVQGRSAALLVDGGTAIPSGPDLGRRRVVPALRALGVERLDLVVGTHADLDHRGGLVAVLESIEVGALWLPRGGTFDPGFESLRAVARNHGVPLKSKGSGSAPERFGDLWVEPLWPPAKRRGDSRNHHSLVVRVKVGDLLVLLPGDIGSEAETSILATGADVRADVLVVAHHGSRTSSSESWLAAVQSSVGVVSAPCSGRFGFPHASVMERVRGLGSSVWWTGRDGAVVVRARRPLSVWSHVSHRRCRMRTGSSAPVGIRSDTPRLPSGTRSRSHPLDPPGAHTRLRRPRRSDRRNSIRGLRQTGTRIHPGSS